MNDVNQLDLPRLVQIDGLGIHAKIDFGVAGLRLVNESKRAVVPHDLANVAIEHFIVIRLPASQFQSIPQRRLTKRVFPES